MEMCTRTDSERSTKDIGKYQEDDAPRVQRHRVVLIQGNCQYTGVVLLYGSALTSSEPGVMR